MSESTTSPSAEETPASARDTETHGHEETRHKEKRIAFDVTYDGSIFEVKFSPSKKIRAAFASLAEALSLEQDEVHIPEDNAEKTIKEIGDNTIEAKYKGIFAHPPPFALCLFLLQLVESNIMLFCKYSYI